LEVIEASSDCQPERKLIAAEVVDGKEPEADALANPAFCAVPYTLPRLGVRLAPVPISIVVATVML
jgi:hypothetical protein